MKDCLVMRGLFHEPLQGSLLNLLSNQYFMESTTFFSWLTWPTASSNFETKHTVDGKNPAVAPVELGSLSRYLQGFMHPTGICLESLSSTVPIWMIFMKAMS